MQDLRALVVREAHAPVADGATGDGKRPCPRRVPDVRLCHQHLLEATESRDGLLERLREVQDVVDRGGEERDVQRERRKVLRLHLALRDEPAAQAHDHGVQRAHERGDAGLVRAHGAIHPHLGVQVRVVAGAELVLLNVLRGKALHHADAGEAVLHA